MSFITVKGRDKRLSIIAASKLFLVVCLLLQLSGRTQAQFVAWNTFLGHTTQSPYLNQFSTSPLGPLISHSTSPLSQSYLAFLGLSGIASVNYDPLIQAALSNGVCQTNSNQTVTIVNPSTDTVKNLSLSASQLLWQQNRIITRVENSIPGSCYIYSQQSNNNRFSRYDSNSGNLFFDVLLPREAWYRSTPTDMNVAESKTNAFIVLQTVQNRSEIYAVNKTTGAFAWYQQSPFSFIYNWPAQLEYIEESDSIAVWDSFTQNGQATIGCVVYDCATGTEQSRLQFVEPTYGSIHFVKAVSPERILIGHDGTFTSGPAIICWNSVTNTTHWTQPTSIIYTENGNMHQDRSGDLYFLNPQPASRLTPISKIASDTGAIVWQYTINQSSPMSGTNRAVLDDYGELFNLHPSTSSYELHCIRQQAPLVVNGIVSEFCKLSGGISALSSRDFQYAFVANGGKIDMASCEILSSSTLGVGRNLIIDLDYGANRANVNSVVSIWDKVAGQFVVIDQAALGNGDRSVHWVPTGDPSRFFVGPAHQVKLRFVWTRQRSAGLIPFSGRIDRISGSIATR